MRYLKNIVLAISCLLISTLDIVAKDQGGEIPDICDKAFSSIAELNKAIRKPKRDSLSNCYLDQVKRIILSDFPLDGLVNAVHIRRMKIRLDSTKSSLYKEIIQLCDSLIENGMRKQIDRFVKPDENFGRTVALFFETIEQINEVKKFRVSRVSDALYEKLDSTYRNVRIEQVQNLTHPGYWKNDKKKSQLEILKIENLVAELAVNLRSQVKVEFDTSSMITFDLKKVKYLFFRDQLLLLKIDFGEENGLLIFLDQIYSDYLQNLFATQLNSEALYDDGLTELFNFTEQPYSRLLNIEKTLGKRLESEINDYYKEIDSTLDTLNFGSTSISSLNHFFKAYENSESLHSLVDSPTFNELNISVNRFLQNADLLNSVKDSLQRDLSRKDFTATKKLIPKFEELLKSDLSSDNEEMVKSKILLVNSLLEELEELRVALEQCEFLNDLQCKNRLLGLEENDWITHPLIIKRVQEIINNG